MFVQLRSLKTNYNYTRSNLLTQKILNTNDSGIHHKTLPTKHIHHNTTEFEPITITAHSCTKTTL